MSFVAVTIDPECRVDEGVAVSTCLAVDEQAREFAAAHGCEYTPVIYFSWDVLEKLQGADLAAFVKGGRLCIVKLDIGVPGAAGFHDDVAGVIFARVEFGPDWSVVLSHEVLEEQLDPTCDRFAQLDGYREQALEACDRVEGDTYRIGDALVSNYLLPSAFVPTSEGPWDKLGQLRSWDGMTGGGYMIVRNHDGSEVDVFAETDHARARADQKRARPDTRLARRLAETPVEVSGQTSQNAAKPAKPAKPAKGRKKRAA